MRGGFLLREEMKLAKEELINMESAIHEILPEGRFGVTFDNEQLIGAGQAARPQTADRSVESATWLSDRSGWNEAGYLEGVRVGALTVQAQV